MNAVLTTGFEPQQSARVRSESTGKMPPLFRGIDWIAFSLTTLVVWIGYFLTLAPDLTLEDSGELATASFYGGIPHPPGYPVWTIYTWFWANLIPIGNVAWRVALASATAGALACGLIALLVSRGSSMLIEGLEDLKQMRGGWENLICLTAGFAAGTLMGFNGYFWSQAVIVEVYTFSVLSLIAVMACLLRWIYAPHQRRYLYLAMFIFGICFTNHQTLLIAAMGIEVAIAARDERLGRNLFLGNSIIYLGGLIAWVQGLIPMFNSPAGGGINMIFFLFNLIGLLSIAAYVWFAIRTKEDFWELLRDGALLLGVCLLALAPNEMFRWLAVIGGFGSLCLWVYLTWFTRKEGLEQLVVMLMGLLWIAGASLYLYMAIAGMSTPPMQWGYPRTVEGFFHAITRGQYEKPNPTNIFADPLRFLVQLRMLAEGVGEEFNWVYTFVALVPLLYFFKMQKRERAWILGIVAIYFCMGVLLMILLNPAPEKASRELVRVFFTASHAQVALMVGYGIAIVAAYMATHYQAFRRTGIIGGLIALALAILTLFSNVKLNFFGEASSPRLLELLQAIGWAFMKDRYGLPVIAGLILVGMTALFVVAMLVYKNRAPLAITLAIFFSMPVYSVLCHWFENEQRDHLFGYWFGHDMFTPPFTDESGEPLYPPMARDAILYGGTDPGRFCPTYMIFCESFIPPKCKPRDPEFDRRDVYIITQNALADGTYLAYLRSQYNRHRQIDPPFFQDLFRSSQERRRNVSTNFVARLMIPLDKFFSNLGSRIEKRRRTFTSWFKPDDFLDFVAFVGKLCPGPNQDLLSGFIFTNLSARTKEMILSGRTDREARQAVASDLNSLLERELYAGIQMREITRELKWLKTQMIFEGETPKLKRLEERLRAKLDELSKVEPLYKPERFADRSLSDYVKRFVQQQLEIERWQNERPEVNHPPNYARIRLNRLLLEEAYPGLITKSKAGVYPDMEIYIASPEDAERCYAEYLQDAVRRKELNQLKPGEIVEEKVEPTGERRVSIQGQVAVMTLNGYIAKVIFDKNPDHEFYVEESLPLDWMYPHLTPYGIIMKVNREPVPEFTDDIIRRDHSFWRKYSQRLIGDWIDYDTPISNIVAFVEKVYIRKDFRGFTGDRKFIRDDQAQKAFSKLRSAIAGVYAWRYFNSKSEAEKQRVLKEADFAFRQAWAFCPYSPEPIYRYANLLVNVGRVDDAILITETGLRLDPYNKGIEDLLKTLKDIKAHGNEWARFNEALSQLEKHVQNNPDDLGSAIRLAYIYLQMQRFERAFDLAKRVYTHSNVTPAQLREVGGLLAALNRIPELEPLLERLVSLETNRSEYWYDLAAVRAYIGKDDLALETLRKAFEMNAEELKSGRTTNNLTEYARTDPRFDKLRQNPSFKKLLAR